MAPVNMSKFVVTSYNTAHVVTNVCRRGIWDPGRFCQSRFQGLTAFQSRDFGITKIVFFDC